MESKKTSIEDLINQQKNLVLRYEKELKLKDEIIAEQEETIKFLKDYIEQIHELINEATS